MLEGVLIPLRGSRRRAAVHPTSAVRHRRRSARAPAPCLGSASRGEMVVMVSGAYLRQQAEILIAISRGTFDLGGRWAVAGDGGGTSDQGGRARGRARF